MNTTTRIIIGANAYASVKYSVDDADGLHIGTIDFLLAGGRSSVNDLAIVAQDYRTKAARYLRMARIADEAADELTRAGV
jgi:hypothetical protein